MEYLPQSSDRIYGFAQPQASTQPLQAYYDSPRKEYLAKNERGEWLSFTDSQFRKRLMRHGYSKNPEGKKISPLDEHLLILQDQYDVTYAGPMAGSKAGFSESQETRFLVTNSPKIIEPVPGDWPTLYELLEGMLVCDGHDQRPYFYGWVKVGFEALRTYTHRPGQALVFAGPAGSGKSLVQNILTLIFGGRAAKPYQFMAGMTQFNSDLFTGEHLIMEDEQASTNFQIRRNFGTKIKEITVNELQRCHPKHRPAFYAKPFWRLTISTNDEPENLCVLPLIDDSMEDKLMLFKVASPPRPFPTKTAAQHKAYWEKLVSELPAFLNFIVGYEIPPDLASERFGIMHFHHPNLLGEIDGLSPETRLLSIIDDELFVNTDTPEWNGTASELEGKLSQSAACIEFKKLLNFNGACGTLLGRLAKKQPDRVQKNRKESRREWSITRGSIPVVKSLY